MLTHEDDDMNTPLLISVESGSNETARILITAGANVNHCNKDVMYPLHLACTIGSIEIVKVRPVRVIIGYFYKLSLLLYLSTDVGAKPGQSQLSKS